MISLMRAMEEQVKELLTSVVESFKATLLTVGETGARACPPAAQDLAAKLSGLGEQLSSGSSSSQVKETGTLIQGELKSWGARASGYYRQKSEEIKEIMALVAQAAEQAGKRDQRNAGRFRELTIQLREIADLEDLTRVRQSLFDSTARLHDYVDDMVREGQQSADQLRDQLASYESRLQEAERLAVKDPLTGLDNRRKVEHEMESRVARGTRFCLLILDLDRFKLINDQYGHLAGDEVLKQFSQELRSQIRYPDVIARWGGDEFLAVLDAGLSGAETCAKRVCEWVFGDYTFETAGGAQKVRLEGSVGIAEWLPGEPVSEVVRRADAEMYRQKKAGGRRSGQRCSAAST